MSNHLSSTLVILPCAPAFLLTAGGCSAGIPANASIADGGPGNFGYGGFGIPLPVEPLTLLAMAGLSITGNLLCILRTVTLQQNAGAS